MTDADLVARVRQGDADAFGELVSRHQTAVYRAALAAGTVPHDADDVAQEAFLLAFRRLGTFRGEASFKTWLLTITWNQAINFRRANTRWRRRLVDVESPGEDEPAWERIASPSGTPEQIAADTELRGLIRTQIESLPHKLRDALLLAQSGEYTYEEMSAMLKSPTGTIKWRVSEARRLLKQQLESLKTNA